MPPPKPPTLRSLHRPFSTTPPTSTLTTTTASAPRYTKRPPPYPYGPAQHYKQSDSGLYGGATLQFGNKVSSKNAIKTRRTWRPNMHHKRLWSDSLGRFVQVKVQARVLRTMDKCGGLDEYLLGEKPGRIKELGLEGWRLRWLVMRTGKVRRRVEKEREALGLVGRGKGEGIVGVRESGEEALEDDVERASGEVVGRIQGAKAGAKGPLEAGAEAGEEPELVELEKAEAEAAAAEKKLKQGMEMEKETEGGIWDKIKRLFARR